MSLIEVDERTFVANVNELVEKIQKTLLAATQEKPYLGAEIYIAVKRLLVAYGQALGPEAVKLIEKNVIIVSPQDYKEC
jgi:hypothetical protein